ncbi:MAG TPA: multicopper oxidase family protein [Actinomycetota bacterium]|nr:multicopper oxidase family protein [Actinomycetota bacterium]
MPSWRKVLPFAVALVVVAVLAGYWVTSRLPPAYSVMSMGEVDTGGAPMAAHHGQPSVSVTGLVVDEGRVADVVYDLTASQGPVELADGRRIEGFALNGTTPGPTLEAVVGQLVEVRVHNQNVTDGMTLHWHGVDVPNSADGVAGVTQDAIPPGGDFTYRFVAQDTGTYWYHSHQVSHAQVLGGLLGALVVKPASEDNASDVVTVLHTYDGVRTINGRAGDSRVPAQPGDMVRVRVINTDPGPAPVWVAGARFRVVAVDGRDLNEPALVQDQSVVITAGGRADLQIRVPRTGAVRVQVAGASLTLGEASAPEVRTPQQAVDFLHYGRPAPEQVGFDPYSPDRQYRYDIGRRPGLLNGKPGLWWTVNGHMYPDIPMFMIRTGEVGRFTITNSSGQVHPMHLHGHHMLVLSRDGVASDGSPWWVDSLNVEDGQTYEVAFLADNPGIWMDHCHNLPHAAQGLTAHLMYEGVITPFVIRGEHANAPE